MDAGPWPHLHDVIRRTDGVLVVLHDNHGVADVAQAFERGDHLDIVFRMQTDAGFVEDIAFIIPDRRCEPASVPLARFNERLLS